ncbi:MAG: SBBP repeat-containing protein [Blastocatellia bacterium]
MKNRSKHCKHPNRLVIPIAAMAALVFLLNQSAPSGPNSIPQSSNRMGAALTESGEPTKTQLAGAFAHLPLYFIENRGQIDPRVAFYVQGREKMLYFTSDGVTIALTDQPDSQKASLRPAALNADSGLKRGPGRWAVRLDFVGSDPNVEPEGSKQAEAVFSYFKGAGNQRQRGIKSYQDIIYRNLWPGIDLVYEGTVNRMKYRFVVRPGADPQRIRLAYRGASAVKINLAGELEVRTPVGSFSDERPVSYQGVNGRQIEVATAYKLDGALENGAQGYGFELGEYDRSRELVIDPAVLIYAGYIGGSGRDGGNSIAVDKLGNVYVTGSTASAEGSFPESVGPDLSFNGDTDAFVAKINASGTAILYCGYIGGVGSDTGNDIAVDGAGNAYISGCTDSTEASFPETVGPDLSFNGGTDAFVAKVNAAGNELVYCGYLGGGDNDEGIDIAVDGEGNAFVTGPTRSRTGFPVKIGPSLTHNGEADAFVTKVNPAGTEILYSGFIGGAFEDVSHGIAVDGSGNAYVVGNTNSTEASFPEAVGPDLSFNGGLSDAFVAKINPSGSTLLYCGYIGGGLFDSGNKIAIDGADNVYVTGATNSNEASFPEAVGPDLSFNGGIADAYIAKVNPSGISLLYCGYIGGSGLDESRGIAVDYAGSAYVAGHTASTEASFPVTVGPDLSFNGGFMDFGDAFVAKINAAGTSLIYCGYIGGSGVESGSSIAVDNAGNAYVAADTGSDEKSFPDGDGFGELPGPIRIHSGNFDAFVVKVSDLPDVCLQDDRSRDILKVKLSTGEYEFIRCDFFPIFFPPFPFRGGSFTPGSRPGLAIGGFGFDSVLSSYKGWATVTGEMAGSCTKFTIEEPRRAKATLYVCPPSALPPAYSTARTLISSRFGSGFSITDRNPGDSRCTCY